MTPFERDVTAAVEQYRVPGLGFALINQGREVLSRGFGTRNLDRGGAVDADTLFAIGSVSKSFTCAAIAMLVDEGSLDWDTRVIDLMPSFRLFDPYATREMTVRDLLVHRSGLARGDFMWYKTPYTSEEVLHRARHLEPSWTFRTTFGYQNIMYVAAGEVIRTVSGLSWDDFIDRRLIEPLGMTRSRSHLQYIDDRSNVASPHAELDDTLRAIPHEIGTNSNAAGSIYSSARDMLQWLRLHLGDGSIDGRRLLTSGSLNALHTPQMLIAYVSPWSEMFPDASFLSYAYGWFVFSYRGQTVVTHSGNIDGMTAVACVVPAIGFGLVALANADGSSLPQALVYRAIDDALAGGSKNWLVQFKNQYDDAHKRLDFMLSERKDVSAKETPASPPLSAYAGVYEDPFYGSATVREEGDALALQLLGLNGKLEHLHFDVFTLRPENEIFAKYQPSVRFDRNDFGEPAALTASLLGGVELRLKRNPNASQPVAAAAIDPAPMLGRYASALTAASLAIEALGDALKITLPGSFVGGTVSERVLTLVPISNDCAVVAGLPLTLAFKDLRDRRFASVELRASHQLPFVFDRSSG